VVRAPRRDALRQHLAQAGIETEVYYPTPLHLQPCFAHLGNRAGDLPEAEKAAQECLALPVHPDLDHAQLAHVAAQVGAFYE
jgi:dTDP-4-amino-4,6-dideoxygalactose transaminase